MHGFRSILVHIDSRLETHPGLDRAAELARQQNADLKIVDIVPDFSWPMRLAAGDHEEVKQAIADKKQQAINKILNELQGKGIKAVGKVLFGKGSTEIIAEVQRSKHDLVIKDAKGLDSRRSGYFGTTVTRLMRSCPCTVWAYRSPASGLQRVIAAVDATAADDHHANLNHRILDVARTLSHPNNPHVVHAWSLYGERLIQDYMKREEFEALVCDAKQQSQAKMAELLEPLGMAVDAPEVHLLRGSEEQEIAKLVNEENFDVLVMGTIGRSGISGLLIGNTAEILFDRVACSVVAVKIPSGDSA